MSLPATDFALLLLTDRPMQPPSTEITSKQVRDWMLQQAPALKSLTPDYVALTCRVSINKGVVACYFTAYAEGGISTSAATTPEEALAALGEKLADTDRIKREKIEELRAELLRLEAEALPA